MCWPCRHAAAEAHPSASACSVPARSDGGPAGPRCRCGGIADLQVGCVEPPSPISEAPSQRPAAEPAPPALTPESNSSPAITAGKSIVTHVERRMHAVPGIWHPRLRNAATWRPGRARPRLDETSPAQPCRRARRTNMTTPLPRSMHPMSLRGRRKLGRWWQLRKSQEPLGNHSLGNGSRREQTKRPNVRSDDDLPKGTAESRQAAPASLPWS